MDMKGVKHFSWETVWLELLLNVPTLMKLLCCLVNKPEDKKPLLCTIVAMILKNRRNSMALVQRAVSVVLYGNGVGKKVQIYMNFKIQFTALNVTFIPSLYTYRYIVHYNH